MLNMRKGGRRLLVIPPALAYGSDGVPGRVPADSTLVFETEIRRVRSYTLQVHIGCSLHVCASALCLSLTCVSVCDCSGQVCERLCRLGEIIYRLRGLRYPLSRPPCGEPGARTPHCSDQ